MLFYVELDRVRSTLEVRDGGPVVVRVAEGSDAELVRREARTLRAIAGPGAPAVLELFDDGDRARLVMPVAPPLHLESAPTPVVVDALARVADVLQRATAAGIAHGPIRDDDILSDGASVLLSGWQRPLDPDTAHDVTQFGRFTERLAVHHPVLAPIARRALAPDPPTFAALASALRASLPRTKTRHPSSGALPFLIGLLVAVVAVGLAVPGHRARSPRSITLKEGPRLTVSGNVVERGGDRWAVGERGDVVVIGRWNCDSSPLPAVLRPSTGRIWTFRSWPTGAAPTISHQPVEAPGAVGLRVRHDGGCDRLVSVDDQGRETLVR